MPEDGETFACKYCEKEFDSKRGLHIHQTQVHPDEEKQKVEDTEAEETENEEDDSSDMFSEDKDLELEKTEEEFSVKAGKGDSTVNMSLTTRQVAAAALIVGLLVGGIIAGIYFSGVF
jgi:hypothetical protein